MVSLERFILCDFVVRGDEEGVVSYVGGERRTLFEA